MTMKLWDCAFGDGQAPYLICSLPPNIDDYDPTKASHFQEDSMLLEDTTGGSIIALTQQLKDIRELQVVLSDGKQTDSLGSGRIPAPVVRKEKSE